MKALILLIVALSQLIFIPALSMNAISTDQYKKKRGIFMDHPSATEANFIKEKFDCGKVKHSPVEFGYSTVDKITSNSVIHYKYHEVTPGAYRRTISFAVFPNRHNVSQVVSNKSDLPNEDLLCTEKYASISVQFIGDHELELFILSEYSSMNEPEDYTATVGQTINWIISEFIPSGVFHSATRVFIEDSSIELEKYLIELFSNLKLKVAKYLPIQPGINKYFGITVNLQSSR
ncbi:MAG: hypothetical protein KC505_08760 [Myxococcales bacterium]|nr:hypothetical protein [Myxococcales bacterium]USN50315.1 MAG: hypothetical protein H6731_08615 [Myxococcales bacterium]